MEPRIEYVLEELSSPDFVDNLFADNQDLKAVGSKMAEVLYFLRKEQAMTLYSEIYKKTEEERKRIFKSTVELYPLSKELLFLLLRRAEGTPAKFLEIYDMDCELLKKIQNDLSEIEKNSTRDSRRGKYNVYQDEIDQTQKEIDKLWGEIEEWTNKSEEVKEKRREKEKLEEKLRKLQLENEETLGNEIEELKGKIKEQKRENEEKAEERQKLTEKFQAMLENMEGKKELGNSTNGYQEALDAMRRCIQSLGDRG